MPHISYSQNFEDVYIYRAFRDVKEGFYIDIGAYHPDIDSVTRFFYDRGWSGVNVEPGPTFDLFAVRQRDTNLRVAVSGTAGWRTFYYHPEDPGTSTLLSALQPELVGRTRERRVDTIWCTTLDQLIDEFAAGKHVHFLKLDIEGEEQVVIEATHWRQHRPELLIVESTRPYTNIRRDEAWNPFLAEAGYIQAFFDGINTYYLREESLFRRGAFDRPVNILDDFQRRSPELEEMRGRVATLEARLRTAEGDRSVC